MPIASLNWFSPVWTDADREISGDATLTTFCVVGPEGARHMRFSALRCRLWRRILSTQKLSKLLTNLQLLFRGTEAGTVHDGLVFNSFLGNIGTVRGLRRLVPWVVGNLESAEADLSGLGGYDCWKIIKGFLPLDNKRPYQPRALLELSGWCKRTRHWQSAFKQLEP